MISFDKLLIANRGEIACRIMRTAKRLGIQTVAVFSQIDADSLHVRSADEAYLIGPAPAKDSYLNIERIIAIAQQCNAKAIHPGYGFLAENSQFALACEQANLIFIGPSAEAINLMADKNTAKCIMDKYSVPVLPGFFIENQNFDELAAIAKQLGFPIVLKAVAGGGGKGLRVVLKESDIEDAYHAVKREASAFFNNDKILIEKYLPDARHVEVQIIADTHGNIIPLYTRDCSLQRRHQKVLEEAPAPALTDIMEQNLMEAGIQAARAINYTNAGTVEFLLSENAFYFLEMNTRLQVEHPVTEMITGLDLVEWQLRIADGQSCDISVKKKGHAIELRLNAEDPQKNFLPSSGHLHYFNFPRANSIFRIDSGYQQGDKIDIFYDSLLAKLIVWAEDRLAAIRYMQNQLMHSYLFGIKTNLPTLSAILANPLFQAAQLSTHLLQDIQQDGLKKTSKIAVIAAAVFLIKFNTKKNTLPHHDPYSPWHIHDGWRLDGTRVLHVDLDDGDTNYALILERKEANYSVKIDDYIGQCSVLRFKTLTADVYQLELLIDNQFHFIKIFYHQYKIELCLKGNMYTFMEKISDHDPLHEEETSLIAPMPGTLVALYVTPGQKVVKGEKLLVIEAMKMEHTLYAPKQGVIKACFHQQGDSIKEGANLIEFEMEDDAITSPSF